MESPFALTDELRILPSYIPVPGYGLLPANAFVLLAREPVLVDAGIAAEREAFLAALAQVVNPAALRWLWLTHADPDHVGAVHRLLDMVPDLRVITTFLGAGKLGLFGPVAPDRLYLLNPGQTIDVGDRRLRAVKPPTYDAPETTGFLDERTGTLFSADCFGALLSAPAQDAGEVPPPELAAGQALWATVDAPWLSRTDRTAFAASLREVRDLAPPLVLGSHLPPARGLLDRLVDTLATTPDLAPFTGPDQAAMVAMVQQAASS